MVTALFILFWLSLVIACITVLPKANARPDATAKWLLVAGVMAIALALVSIATHIDIYGI